MSTARAQLLDRAVEFSNRMCASAEQGDWEQVIALEPQRRELLQQAFATRAPVDANLAVRVRQILDLDKGLMEMSLKARDQVATEIGQMRQTRKVSKAYQAVTG